MLPNNHLIATSKIYIGNNETNDNMFPSQDGVRLEEEPADGGVPMR